MVGPEPGLAGSLLGVDGGVETECVSDDLPVIAAPPLPTETVACIATLDERTCLAAGGTWVLGAAALCRCP